MQNVVCIGLYYGFQAILLYWVLCSMSVHHGDEFRLLEQPTQQLNEIFQRGSKKQEIVLVLMLDSTITPIFLVCMTIINSETQPKEALNLNYFGLTRHWCCCLYYTYSWPYIISLYACINHVFLQSKIALASIKWQKRTISRETQQ